MQRCLYYRLDLEPYNSTTRNLDQDSRNIDEFWMKRKITLSFTPQVSKKLDKQIGKCCIRILEMAMNLTWKDHLINISSSFNSYFQQLAWNSGNKEYRFTWVCKAWELSCIQFSANGTNGWKSQQSKEGIPSVHWRMFGTVKDVPCCEGISSVLLDDIIITMKGI